MRVLSRSLLSRGGLAILSVALAVPLTLLLPPLEQAPCALLFAAVMPQSANAPTTKVG
jgi:hypothetical protein